MKEIEIPDHLIDGCRQKKPEAQEAVYKSVYTYFMKIGLRYTGNYDDASNILQDAFIKIFTRMDGYTGKGQFIGWMKRIVVNTAIDFIRREKQTQHMPLNAQHELLEEEEDLAERFINDEKQLLSIIRELPTMHLMVFNLFVMDDCPHQEIAERLSISVASSKWYLFEARKILKKKLTQLQHG